MASAEKRFARLLDAHFILAKGTQGDITKMDPDIILKSLSAINKLSLCLSIPSSFCYKKFLEAVLASRAPQQASSTENTCCSPHRGVSISESVLKVKPANPSCHPESYWPPASTPETYCNYQPSTVNTASWSIEHFLIWGSDSLVEQLRMLAP